MRLSKNLLLGLIAFFSAFSLMADQDVFNLNQPSEIFKLGKVGAQEYYIQNIHLDIGTGNYTGVILLRTKGDRPDKSFVVGKGGAIMNEEGQKTKLPSVVQVLYHGINCGSVSQKAAKLESNGFRLNFKLGIGRYEAEKEVHDFWKKDGKTFRLESHELRNLYELQKQAYFKLLEEGDLAGARKVELDWSSNGGGWDCFADEYNLAYLEASASKAKTLYGKGDHFEAGCVALQAFRATLFPACDVKDENKVITWATKDNGENESVSIPNTAANIELVNNLAWYLYEGGFTEESIAYFKLVIQTSPNRVVAHLNLADALWELGRKTEAKQSYHEYLRLFEKQGLKDQPVTRALERG